MTQNVTQNVLLIYGGQSGEHDVSCVSAEFIEQKLLENGHKVYPVYIDRGGNWFYNKRVSRIAEENRGEACRPLFSNSMVSLDAAGATIECDFVFPMIHGTTGEDGKLQGLLEFYRLPFAGSGSLSSALCMDKIVVRSVFKEAGIAQVPHFSFHNSEWQKESSGVLERAQRELNFPIFVKPANLGSSVGVSKCVDAASLSEGIQEALRYDDHVICEQGIDARELEVSVLGNYPHYEVAGPGEIIVHDEFYSYEAKYIKTDGADLELEANVDAKMAEQIHAVAKSAFGAVRGDGFARIDFFVDKNTQELYLNEINTLPGFTPISMFPLLWKNASIDSGELIQRIVELGVARHKRCLALHNKSQDVPHNVHA